MAKHDIKEIAIQLATNAGLDPNSMLHQPKEKPKPTWCSFVNAAKDHIKKLNEPEKLCVTTQSSEYANAPLTIIGNPDAQTITQMRNCMSIGNVVSGVLCADAHLGYAQPVGATIAYKDQISISGVGFDIGCGNMASKLDVKYSDIKHNVYNIMNDINKTISFGVGRTNNEKVEHILFDNTEAWNASDMENYRQKAVSQLGTVGSGNHYVDLLYDENDNVWIGVHFGSRGLGHTSATKYLKMAGGVEGINVPPTVVDINSEIGQRYIAAMKLAGQYSYAGREYVVEKVCNIIGANILDTVHNNHNFSFNETHNNTELQVVRKGTTPAFPGQRGFVGGSMADICVILEGVESQAAKDSLYSTVHGAGRLFGRMEAKRRFTKNEMDSWLQSRNVTLIGGDLDESPMAYRRLQDVLAYHHDSIKVLHTLNPFGVIMAGNNEFDPFKD